MLEVEAGRWLVARELDVPDRARIEADVVVTGTCRVGAGAHVLGSIKSHGDTFLAADVRVDGSVVSGRNLSIGSRCRISGPVIAEMKIDLEAGCRIGSPELPTTVSAPSIGAECGAVAHGTVWARTTGDVRHAEPGLRPSVET